MSSNQQMSGTGNGRQNFRIRPSNAPANNIFSYEGNPVLSFQLPSSNVLLDPTSLRITGKLRFTPSQVAGLVADNINIDQFLGINSVFDSATWSSLMSRSVIEKINNYQKLLNSILPALKSSDQFQAGLQSESLATNDLSYQKTEIISNMLLEEGVSFSVPVYTGVSMASGNRLPLMKLGGLILSMDLSSNEAVFLVQDDTLPKYQLVDVSLTGDYYIPEDEERQMLSSMNEGSIELNTFTSLFSVLQSSQHTSQFNLGLKEVIACYFSFVPTSFINNYKYNQFQSLRINDANGEEQQIVKLNFLRNGTQMPFLYDLDVVDNSNEAELMRYYLMSLKRLNELTKTTISSENLDPRWNIGSSSFPLTTENQGSSLNHMNYVLGVPYDIISGLSGANFSNQPLTINIDSNLSSSNPNAIYFFTLSKTLISYDPQGIRVMN
jgi:hypothetical protein